MASANQQAKRALIFQNTVFAGQGPQKQLYRFWSACGVNVPAGSPSHGGNVVAYFFFFFFVLVSISVVMALSTVFHSINSPDNSPLSHSVLTLLNLSALLVISTTDLFMKVSFSPEIILRV